MVPDIQGGLCGDLNLQRQWRVAFLEWIMTWGVLEKVVCTKQVFGEVAVEVAREDRERPVSGLRAKLHWGVVALQAWRRGDDMARQGLASAAFSR